MTTQTAAERRAQLLAMFSSPAQTIAYTAPGGAVLYLKEVDEYRQWREILKRLADPEGDREEGGRELITLMIACIYCDDACEIPLFEEAASAEAWMDGLKPADMQHLLNALVTLHAGKREEGK